MKFTYLAALRLDPETARLLLFFWFAAAAVFLALGLYRLLRKYEERPAYGALEKCVSVPSPLRRGADARLLLTLGGTRYTVDVAGGFGSLGGTYRTAMELEELLRRYEGDMIGFTHRMDRRRTVTQLSVNGLTLVDPDKEAASQRRFALILVGLGAALAVSGLILGFVFK